MAEGLKLKIGADLAAAISALKSLQSELNQTGSVSEKSSAKASQAIDAMNKSLNGINTDFAKKFEEATNRINANIDHMVNEALGLGDANQKAATDSIKSLNQLEAELDGLANKINSATDVNEIKRLGEEFKKVEGQIRNIKVVGGLNVPFDKLTASSGKATDKLRQVVPASNSATFALTNLGRIVQDAPFGFLGISNNLNPMLESFQRLKAESGSTGAALKALGSSLIGSGGLGLIVSAVTAGLVLFGDKIFSSGKQAKDAKEEVNEFGKSISDIGNAVGKDAARVSTLFNALESGTLTLGQRKKALEELKSTNVEFFGALKEEEGVIKGLQTAYDEYLKRIDQIGKAKAVEAQLAKLFDKKIELELSIDPKFIAATSAQTQGLIGKLQKELESLGGPVKVNAGQQIDFGNAQLKRRLDIQTKILELEQGSKFLQDKNFSATQKSINDIDLQIKGLLKIQSDIGNFDITDKKPDKDESELDKQIKKIKEEIAALEELKKTAGLFNRQEFQLADLKVDLSALENTKSGLLNPTQLQRQIDSIIDAADVHANIPIRVVTRTKPTVTVSPVTGNGALDNLNEKDFSKANQHLLEMQKLTKEIVSIVPEIGRVFESVFDDIASGGKNALQIFGQAIVGIIKKLLAAAITAAIFTAIISAATGGTFGAGTTATALSTFKTLFGQLGGLKLAKGGITTGPTLAMIGDNPSGKEAVIPFERMGDFIDKVGGGGFIATAEIGFDKILIGIRRQQRREGNLT